MKRDNLVFWFKLKSYFWVKLADFYYVKMAYGYFKINHITIIINIKNSVIIS